MLRSRALVPSVAIAALSAGCGPTSVEIGQAVLWAAPIITLVALGVASIYALLWRPLVGELRPAPRLGLVVVGVQLAIAMATFSVAEIDPELVMIAVLVVGASYLAIQVVAMRLMVHRGRYGWAALVPWLVLYPPALFLLTRGESTGGEADDLALMVLILPGYGGWVALPLLFLALLEVVIRRARARRLPPLSRLR